MQITGSALSLNVADVEASAEFAIRHLGFAPEMSADGFVSLAREDAGAHEEAADGYLQQWGNLDKESVFLDGGVLDNKPFTHSLRAIFCRTAGDACSSS